VPFEPSADWTYGRGVVLPFLTRWH